ncbi:MAG TPA: helix-turn-helix domain-containing protein [Pseudonocardiaceae bacterium]|jgi:DNA-binding HxlR family transcriptional regulator|nr:helix-turn-helix domain-containing protein [Pseudonocardiaceae bacterium]
MVDQQGGVTVAGDHFQLTTAGPTAESGALAPDDVVFGLVESAQMETIISELEAMTRRSYGQFCGVSRALEMLGERWSLLIVRDLLVSPKSVADLQAGLPRIPADILAARLRDFERAGIVTRRAAPQPEDSVRYELTEYGTELDDIILRVGRWGARQLGDPRPEEIVTIDSLIMAMRATFQPEMAKGVHVSYEIRVAGIVYNVRVDDGELAVAAGPLPDADLIFEPGMTLKALMAREITPDDVIADEDVRLTGDPALVELFARMFRVGPRVSSA